ncbi:ribosomal protein S5 domain 2-like protein [Wilcoxina mikolae CBS 423.85]|nr:ribosomal protein S5 domain 2-like protein [Wilcoxina mikolae CBS 423.85]
MPKERELSANEKSFSVEALSQGLRLDGRGFDCFRSLELQFGHESGLADVRLGTTRVIACVSGELVEPFPDRPFDGIFTIATELGIMGSTAVETGRQTEQEVLLARLIEKSIARSNAIDLESLCIVSGQQCWHIRADVHFLNHDGGLVDASAIAVVAALQHFRRPDVSVQGGRVITHTLSERVPIALSILHVPICVTFSLFGSEWNVTLLDATLQEEQLRDGEMTITMNRYGEVCQIAKAGGLSIHAGALRHCIRKALVKAEDITTFLAKRLEEDQTQRTGLDNKLECTNDNHRP